MQNFRKYACLVGAVFHMGLVTNVDAEVQDQSVAASPWVDSDYGRTRLIATHEGLSKDSIDPLFLGWEIELKKGWKTYWRSPGDAGKPTLFNFDGSTNLKAETPYYPLPLRFELFGIQTYGYEDHLILPIALKPTDLSRPMDISVRANYMVCEKVCVLLEDQYQLTLPVAEGPAVSSQQQAIMAAVAAVPSKVSSMLDRTQIISATIVGPVGHQSALVTVKGQQLLTGADIILESDPKFHFGKPQRRVLGDGRQVEFIVPVSSYDKTADLNGHTLTITLSDGWNNAIERQVKIQ